MNYEKVTLDRAKEVLNAMDYLASVSKRYSIRWGSTMEGMVNWYWVECKGDPMLPIVYMSSGGLYMLVNELNFLENEYD
jgi:hypothetical protein